MDYLHIVPRVLKFRPANQVIMGKNITAEFKNQAFLKSFT